MGSSETSVYLHRATKRYVPENGSLVLLFNDAFSIGTVVSITEWLMNVEQLEEWELVGETEVLGANLPRFLVN
jgi:hypothetical protein